MILYTIFTFGIPCTHTHQCDPQKSRFIKSMFLLMGSPEGSFFECTSDFGSFDLTLSMSPLWKEIPWCSDSHNIDVVARYHASITTKPLHPALPLPCPGV